MTASSGASPIPDKVDLAHYHELLLHLAAHVGK